MSYTATNNCSLDSSDTELARRTELFLPAYHFGGEHWTLHVGASKSRWSRTMLATAIVTAGECSGSVTLWPSTGANITWKYSETAQSLEVVHSPQLAGSRIQVRIEVGPQAHNAWRVVCHRVIMLVTIALGAILAVLFGSWFFTEVVKQRRKFGPPA